MSWRLDQPDVHLSGADPAHHEQIQAAALDAIRQDDPFILVAFDDRVENLRLLISIPAGTMRQAADGAIDSLLEIAERSEKLHG